MEGLQDFKPQDEPGKMTCVTFTPASKRLYLAKEDADVTGPKRRISTEYCSADKDMAIMHQDLGQRMARVQLPYGPYKPPWLDTMTEKSAQVTMDKKWRCWGRCASAVQPPQARPRRNGGEAAWRQSGRSLPCR